MATPTPGRAHYTPSSTQRAPRQRERPSTPPLPDYEAPIAPLTAAGHNALLSLLKSQSLHHLKTHLQHAGMKLTDSAGEVNERLTDARMRYQKQKDRRRRSRSGGDEDEDGDAVEDEEEINRLAQLEERVGDITGKLELQVRQTVDAEAKVDALTGALGQFEREAEEANAPRSQTRRGGGRSRRGEGEDEDEDGDDGDYEATPERDIVGEPASRRLEDRLNKSYAEWDRLSLTQRYSANNTYIGFYRIVHEAKHAGDDMPPLPHASTWFSHLEDPNATQEVESSRRTRNNRSPSPADSDEIAIERERISRKCPLTLLPFRDPVTSTKCPHSFEREAIESMIAQSPSTVPAPPSAAGAPHSRATRRIRSVKCPVCSVVLTMHDLRSDPVLLRRVRRAEALEREAEDEDMEADASQRKRPRRSGITVASDDEDEDEDEGDGDENHRSKRQATVDPIRIKQERAISSAALDE